MILGDEKPQEEAAAKTLQGRWFRETIPLRIESR